MELISAARSCLEPAASRGMLVSASSASSGCFPFLFPLGLLDKSCAGQNLFFLCFLRNSGF